MFVLMPAIGSTTHILLYKTDCSVVMYMRHKCVCKQNQARKHATAIYNPLTNIHIIRIIAANIVKDFGRMAKREANKAIGSVSKHFASYLSISSNFSDSNTSDKMLFPFLKNQIGPEARRENILQ